MIVAERIEAIAKPVFIDQAGRDHGVDYAALNLKTLRTYPAQIILSVVHDLVGRAFKYFLQPLTDNTLIKVTPSSMAYGDVALPTRHCYGIPHHFPILCGPARTLLFEVRVARFHVDGDFFRVKDIGQLHGRNPIALWGEHSHLQFTG